METKATMKPAQNGTKRLIEKCGKRLNCVRYRYDQQHGEASSVNYFYKLKLTR